ncbi:MAG: glycosyltransferase family 4 protein [Balneolales bacterium]
MPAKRVAILYSELAGYTMACLNALKKDHDVEILVCYWPPAPDAPFAFGQIDVVDHAYPKDKYTLNQLKGIVERFDPHVVVVSGWMDQDYLKIARGLKRKGIPVISGLDASWKGSLRQQILGLLGPWYLKRYINTFWVTGERQAQYAKRLAFKGKNLRYGLYCCDWSRFARSYFLQDEQTEDAFLFVGRYIPIKGIHILLEAYKRYRDRVENPWKLYCAGAGELKEEVERVPGVVNLGFIQPDDLPGIMQRSRVFVLPSLYEPWGVVIQEAAASGLPVICSDACGAGPHLVQDGYNGCIVESGNTGHLTECLVAMSSLGYDEYARMSEGSFELSKQFRPERWATTLMSMAGGQKRSDGKSGQTHLNT